MPITLDGTLGVGTPGITLAGGAITANANQLNSSAEDVNSENRIINGDMGIWQRAVTSTGNGYVAADRWVNALSGGTVTQARQAFTVGDTLGATQPTYFLRQTVSGQTLPAHFALTVQNIEFVRSYAGQTITILGWARRSSGSGNMAVNLLQFFGTGGDVSVSAGAVTVGLVGTWAPFAAVLTVPSIAGKSLGTVGTDGLQLAFWTSAGSDNNSRSNSLGLQTIGVDLWGVHIRVGTWTAADTALYRPRDPGTELALCQRYFETNTSTSGSLNLAIFSGSVVTGGTYYAQVTYNTPKRLTVPAIAITPNSSSGFANVAGTASIGSSGWFESRNANATVATAVWSSFWTADAEL